MLKRRVASTLAALAIGLGGVFAAGPALPAAAHETHHCGHGSPHQTPGGVKCLAPGEYCSHKRGYAPAFAATAKGASNTTEAGLRGDKSQ